MSRSAAAAAFPGLEIHVQRTGTAPVVAVRAWLRRGARTERVCGQALVTGRLLAEGSKQRSWRRLAREAEERGMMVESFGGFEAVGISVDALARDAGRALADVAELILEPALDPRRFAFIKRQAAAELESQLDQPEVRTGRAFLASLYGAHPYGRPLQGEIADLERLRLEDCQAFHRDALAAGVVVAVTGDIDEDETHAAVEARFAALARRAPAPSLAVAAMPRRLARSTIVSLPPGDQGHQFCGHLTVTRADSDRPALDLLGVILGAGSGVRGRLPDRIREQGGLAYDLDVQITAGAGFDRGRFAVYAGTAPENTAAVEQAVREELERLLDRGVEAGEVEEARAYLVGSLPFSVETARLVADRLAEVAFYGPSAAAEALARAWRRLGPQDLLAAARRHLRPGALTVVTGVPRSR